MVRYKKADIKTGYYVCLDNKPWFMAAYHRGEDKRTVKQMRETVFKKGKPHYYKVCRMRPLMYKNTIDGWTYKDKFYLKWVTDVCKNYSEVIERKKQWQK